MDTVLVVGAGPTGLTAAAELARRGVPVRVFDAAPAPFGGSRGKGLQPRSLEVLDPLGVTDRLISLGRFHMPLRHHMPDGSTTDGELHPDAAPRLDTPWHRSLLIPQWRTEQVLRERLTELGVAVEHDARVIGLSQDDGGVVLTFEDGRAVAGGWAIGADGGSSTVRNLIGVDFLGETREDVRMLVADVEVDGLDRDHWHFWQDRSEPMLALCPLPATETWQLQVGHSDPERIADPEEIRRLIATLGPRVRLRRVQWTSSWRLNVRMVERYRAGRVLLAGDAAHVHSPAGGQGMNTGIQDAVNLCWKLAQVASGTAGQGLLDTYAKERLPVAAHVLGLSNRLMGEYIAQRSFRRNETLQLDLTYRGGPLDGGIATGPGPRSGDRAPEAPLADGSSVFLRRRQTEWLLLGFGRELPSLPGATGVDAAGEAATIYEADPDEFVLIRPDGYIGWRGTDPADLRRWFTQLEIRDHAST